MRIQGYVEKNVVAHPPQVINLVANTSTVVLLQHGDAVGDEVARNTAAGSSSTVPATLQTLSKTGECLGKQIFNAGGVNVYYAFGSTCDKTRNFMGYIVPGGMLDVATPQRVECFADGGAGIVAITVLMRRDNFNAN